MKPPVIFLAALALATACESAETKAARAADDARLAIVEQIRKGITATRDKNVDAFLDQIPDEIVMAGADGEPITRDSLRAQVLRTWEAIEATRALDVVVDTIVYHGDSATVLTTTRWDRLMKRPGGSAIDTILSVKKQSEVWRVTPKGWRAFTVETIGGTTTVNGEPIIPGR